MLHILLLILKIIGIIIAVILGILIVLLGILLLVPVRYEIKAESDGKIRMATAMAEVTWLFRLLGVSVRYKGGNLRWRIRIAWKTIAADEGENTETEPAEKMAGRESDTVSCEEPGNRAVDSVSSEKRAEQERTEGREEKGKVEVDEKETENDSENVEEWSEVSEETEKKSVDTKTEETSETAAEKSSEISETVTEERSKVSQTMEEPEENLEKEHEESERTTGKRRLGILEKLQNIYHKIMHTKEQFCVKIKALSGKKDTVTSFLGQEEHKKAWNKVKKESRKLIRRLLPNVLKADIRYGFEDPSLTGRILAGFSILYPFVGDHVHISPDFEHSVLEGRMYVKGKVRAATFVRTAWKLFWCRAVRTTYRDIRGFEW